jgi:hypothetical protein
MAMPARPETTVVLPKAAGMLPTEPWFRHLAAQGHVVMDVAYRLAPETNVPGMQGDVKRAVVWMKRDAASFGVNPDRVVLGGDSAGAHLALLAAYSPDDPLLTPEDVRGEDLSVRGVINDYAQADYRLESRPVVQRGPLAEAVERPLTSLLETWSGARIPSDDEWNAQFTGGQRVDPVVATHVTADELFALENHGYRYDLLAGNPTRVCPAGFRYGGLSAEIACRLRATGGDHRGWAWWSAPRAMVRSSHLW